MHTHQATTFFLPLAAALFTPFASAQQPISFGDLVVLRVGDGAAALGGDTAAMFLDEYTTAGAFVQTFALPTAATGSNHAISVRANATSEGYLNVSSNGLYLMAMGYDAIPGTAGVATAGAATVNRVVARIDILGNVDSSTALSDAYSGGNPRAAVTDDGTRFWTSGSSLSDGGMHFVANVGDTTSVALNVGNPLNCRVAGIFDGQLYTSSASLSWLGVSKVGDGLPTATGAAIDLLPGFPSAGGTNVESAYDYFFADPNTVYVADDNTAATSDGGIQKWTFDGVTWTKQYTFKLTPSSGARALTGFVQDGVATLWAVTNTGTATDLVNVVDTGAASTLNVIASAAVNMAFRGARFMAKPTTLVRIPAACGQADIKVFGNCEVGTDVRTTVFNSQVLPIIGYGTQQLGIPLCAGCTVVHDFSFLVVAGQSTLSLPNSPGLVGVNLFVQGIDFFAPGGCTSPLTLTLTDGYVMTIQ